MLIASFVIVEGRVARRFQRPILNCVLGKRCFGGPWDFYYLRGGEAAFGEVAVEENKRSKLLSGFKVGHVVF